MKPVRLQFITLVLSACQFGCADVGEDATQIETGEPDHSDVVKSDLFAVITLDGADCIEVVDYKLQNELDYIATCKNGKRYRIHVSSEARITVDTHPSE